MTPKLTLITAAVGAALVLGVPAAWGDDYFATRQSETAVVRSPDVVDRAVAAAGQQRHSAMLDARERAQTAGRENLQTLMLDARERALGTKRQVQLGSGVGPDVFERAVQAHGTTGDRFIANDNRFRIDPTNEAVPVSVTGSGGEIEWSQIGIGFGMGILLALGFFLALRSAHVRQLVH